MTFNNAKTTFMVISDTHNFEMDAVLKTCPLRQAQQTKVDVLLHCGDLTQVGGMSAYKKALLMLGSIDAELRLVIGGNHDLSLDGKYWRENLDEEAGDELEEHDEAVAIMTGPLAKAAGVTYLTEGTHTFSLKNGATFTVYASPYQHEFGDWAFGYKRTDDRFNESAEKPLRDNVDIVMTHGPPRGILDTVPSREHLGDVDHLGCDALLKAVGRSRPLMHCFGHLHEGYGVEMHKWNGGEESGEGGQTVSVSKVGTSDEIPKAFSITRGEATLMVNAAIMNDHNEPVNAPWLVELGLGIGGIPTIL